jgi:hypothetical protein
VVSHGRRRGSSPAHTVRALEDMVRLKNCMGITRRSSELTKWLFTVENKTRMACGSMRRRTASCKSSAKKGEQQRANKRERRAQMVSLPRYRAKNNRGAAGERSDVRPWHIGLVAALELWTRGSDLQLGLRGGGAQGLLLMGPWRVVQAESRGNHEVAYSYSERSLVRQRAGGR